MQVTRNENHTPTAFHANIVAMEKGLVSVEDVADDFVHCTQCGACELRCPNTLFTGDFYRHRTRTVDVVKAMRALMVATGNEREGWKLWNERLAEAHQRAGARRRAGQPGARARLGRGASTSPIGGETILFVDCEAAFYRTSYARAFAQLLQKAGVEFGLMREQWCCGGPAAEMGYVDLARKHAEHNVADWRAAGRSASSPDPHDYIAFTEDYPAYFGDDYDFEIVLGVELIAELVRDGRLQLSEADRAHGHLPRPLPAQQAQGRPRGAARAAARDPGPDLQGRRPRDAVVLLLGRRRRPADREAGDHRRDQPPAGRARRAARGRHARQRLPLVRAAAVRGGGRGRLEVVDLFELVAESAGIEVGGHLRPSPAEVQ